MTNKKLKEIKQWMRDYDVRPAELAVELHVSPSTVQNILSGKEHVSEPTILLLDYVMANMVRSPKK